MDFNLNDEQTMLRDTAARVVRELCTLQRRRDRIARGGGIDLDLANQCAELGWSALCIPEGEGGLGGNMTDIALLMIELGRGMSIEPMMSGVLMGGRLLADAGWSGKTRWIDEVLSRPAPDDNQGERKQVGTRGYQAPDLGCRYSGWLSRHGLNP
jgi:alkylation response protein AidB-like acyl-CoA dehydrogenase